MGVMSKPMRIPEQLPRASLPPAGDWRVETSRSAVSISGRASRLAPAVRAEFGDVHGDLHLAADPNGSRVGVCVDVRAVTTGNALWDDLLRVADPLRAADHPLARYISTAVRWTGTDFSVEGVLELAGARVALVLKATVGENADGTVTLRARGSIDPRSAGIRLDLPGARLLMPRSMQLSIAVTAAPTRQSPASGQSRRFALAS
jgi:polyisoprenoid-binding protein YceI